MKNLLAFATKGTGSNEEERLKTLLSKLDADFLPYNKSDKIKSFCCLLKRFSTCRGHLIVMEGTGIAGGIACILGRVLWGHRYVVSSGDAVGPFVSAHVWGLGLPFGIYERILCRLSAGFIGWTPYLVGRALTFGAPRGVTAPGWVIGRQAFNYDEARTRVRRKWGIAADTVVFGLAGALVWSKRRRYCYGLELVKAVRRTERTDIAVVVVGDGTGRDVLIKEAGTDLGKRIFIPGAVPLAEVMETLCGFDVASLPQSTDAVGAFRYTTKISEYREARLPIVTTRIPAAYDLNLGQSWRLPGIAPWDDVFINALAELMREISVSALSHERVANMDLYDPNFDRDLQVARVTDFMSDIQEVH